MWRHGVWLTYNEAETARRVGDGKCNKDIARELGVATQTIKHWISALFATTGTTDRTQLAIWWHTGYIPEEITPQTILE